MSLEILNQPIFALLQDKGRFSYMSIGVTNSGVMDEYAFYTLNMLLENEANTNVIELSLAGMECVVHAPTHLALTGATCQFFINNEPCQMWRRYAVNKGDVIKITTLLEGSRVYLGVKGGFLVEKEFGSNATTLKEHLGGLDGERLKKGDVLSFKPFSNNTYTTKLKEAFIPSYNNTLELRMTLGFQEEFFENKEAFFENTYTISNDFNRMGCKLKGTPLKCHLDGIISEGICFGAVQVPPDGEPIILLKDRQTIGGYAKIGTVLAIDCFKLAQAKPNTKVRFKAISQQEAQAKLKAFYKAFR